MYTQHNAIYAPQDIKTVLQKAVPPNCLVSSSKRIKVYNIPCAFDVETTSCYRDENGQHYTYSQVVALGSPKLEKVAFCYVWQFGINGYVIVGRTLGEFTQMCHTITEELELSENKRLYIYVHNLSYEFQFIQHCFTWNNVFSIDIRKPIYALSNGLEFRCSYLLSGYGLDKLGDQLQKYRCAKKVGDLDYSLIRHSDTPLTHSEIGYCVNDIFVVMAWIQERIEEHKRITSLPITKTGFVRKHCRKLCFRKDGKPNWEYTDLIQTLTIEREEFEMLQRAFAGGFTHANAIHVGEVLRDVDSYDFTSSYPAAMIAERYPMSKGVKVGVSDKAQFEHLRNTYCCVFDVEFCGLFPRLTQDNPISASKCFVLDNAVENNGRVVCADRISLTITNVDFDVIERFYTWRQMRVGVMWVYRKDYLPTPFVRSILDLYAAKTQLKGVKGKEVEYLHAKEMLNSCYGMSVTNPLRDEFTYNGNWDIKAITDDERNELLYKYNTSKNRFLFYPWGVFVTAYARANLFSGVAECGDDYVYSDTDSIKLLNVERHKCYFTAYNDRIEDKLRKACEHHGLSFELCAPKTIKGNTKILGVWEHESRYDRFKTLGAKRYMTEEENALSVTISGVNKHTAIPYLNSTFDEPFRAFDNYLTFPTSSTGKSIHTYIDYPQNGTITDYLGNVGEYSANCAVHLEPTSYTLNLSVMYLNYLRGVKFKE